MEWDQQVSYWKTSGQQDLIAAGRLMDCGHFRHGLFFAHLALEKILKAHVTLNTQTVPPKLHNLVQLARLARLSLAPNQLDFLREFSAYNILGRYPDQGSAVVSPELAQEDWRKCQEVFEWLRSMR